MSEQDPHIIDLDYQSADPDKSPRMTAIILLLCGLMGVGFYVVNSFFTGEDRYYNEEEWDEGTEPVNQRFDITPNLVRGKHVEDSEEDDDAHAIPVKKPIKKPAATSPFSNPFQISKPSNPANPTTQGTLLGK
jgi:hypothetical protein